MTTMEERQEYIQRMRELDRKEKADKRAIKTGYVEYRTHKPKQERKLKRKHKAHYRIQNDLRNEVLNRDGYACTACKAEATLYRKLHVHHIQHREHGGTHAMDNLTTLCDACHIIAHEGEAIARLMRKALIL